ncbi:MAG: phosphoglucosamine mutase, partial [Thermoplasmata archaeon]|nr:phosphoglucosamine mutase [Thermoplasmata archaeon]
IPLYIQGVLSHVDVESIRDRGPRVVLDCANGAAALSSPLLLESLGVSFFTLNANPSGLFPGHPSEPTRENLRELMTAVRESDAGMGVAHDGDGDRTIFVDGEGVYLDGDRSLAIVAGYVTEQAGGGRVVVPVNTSTMVEEVVEENGGEVIYTPIGSPIVARKMMETGAVFGGEENGGLVFPEHQYCRDGAMTLAKILEIVATTGESIKDLASSLPSYFLCKKKMPYPREARDLILERYLDAVSHMEPSTVDGVKYWVEGGWVLVRPSGTEPIFRIQTEGKSRDMAERLADEAMKVLREIISGISAGHS